MRYTYKIMNDVEIVVYHVACACNFLRVYQCLTRPVNTTTCWVLLWIELKHFVILAAKIPAELLLMLGLDGVFGTLL